MEIKRRIKDFDRDFQAGFNEKLGRNFIGSILFFVHSYKAIESAVQLNMQPDEPFMIYATTSISLGASMLIDATLTGKELRKEGKLK
jgi:hypothetical protein